jgi:hypothetical protein
VALGGGNCNLSLKLGPVGVSVAVNSSEIGIAPGILWV